VAQISSGSFNTRPKTAEEATASSRGPAAVKSTGAGGS